MAVQARLLYTVWGVAQPKLVLTRSKTVQILVFRAMVVFTLSKVGIGSGAAPGYLKLVPEAARGSGCPADAWKKGRGAASLAAERRHGLADRDADLVAVPAVPGIAERLAEVADDFLPARLPEVERLHRHVLRPDADGGFTLFRFLF